jgi:hypothetical protein
MPANLQEAARRARGGSLLRFILNAIRPLWKNEALVEKRAACGKTSRLAKQAVFS